MSGRLCLLLALAACGCSNGYAANGGCQSGYVHVSGCSGAQPGCDFAHADQCLWPCTADSQCFGSRCRKLGFYNGGDFNCNLVVGQCGIGGDECGSR